MFRQSFNSTSLVATMPTLVHRRIRGVTPTPFAMNARPEHILTKVTWFVPLVRLGRMPTPRELQSRAISVQLVHILTKLEQLNALRVLQGNIKAVKDKLDARRANLDTILLLLVVQHALIVEPENIQKPRERLNAALQNLDILLAQQINFNLTPLSTHAQWVVTQILQDNTIVYPVPMDIPRLVLRAQNLQIVSCANTV
jgi:hypothetical protein